MKLIRHPKQMASPSKPVRMPPLFALQKTMSESFVTETRWTLLIRCREVSAIKQAL